MVALARASASGCSTRTGQTSSPPPALAARLPPRGVRPAAPVPSLRDPCSGILFPYASPDDPEYFSSYADNRRTALSCPGRKVGPGTLRGGGWSGGPLRAPL